MSNLKQTVNEVSVAGQLVKNNIKVEMNKDKTCQVARGSLVVRTIDGSEVEVSYYANEFKKDKNTGTFSTEKNGMFESLATVSREYKSLEKIVEGEEADIVKINASFDANDYKGQDGTIKSGVRMKANFANRVTDKEMEATPMTATFQTEGVITLIDDETYKGEPTGRVKINLNIIGYQGVIIPISLVAPAEYVDYIKTNYTEGAVAKFWGKIINTSETHTEVQQGGFGESFTKTFTSIVRRYEITGGNPQRTLDEAGIEESEYAQAKAKRKLKLDNLLKEEKNSSPAQGGFGTNGNGATAPAGGFGAPAGGFGGGATQGGNPFGGAPAGGGNPFGAK